MVDPCKYAIFGIALPTMILSGLILLFFDVQSLVFLFRVTGNMIVKLTTSSIAIRHVVMTILIVLCVIMCV